MKMLHPFQYYECDDMDHYFQSEIQMYKQLHLFCPYASFNSEKTLRYNDSTTL
jgi:hypothetical protein